MTSAGTVFIFGIYLIGHGNEYRAQKQVGTNRKVLLNFRIAFGEKIVRKPSEYGKGHHKIVTVRFDEIMSCYRRWIDVMLTEWTKKILQNKQKNKKKLNKLHMSFLL